MNRVSRLLVILAGAGLLASAFLVSAEVILRHTLLFSTNAGSELSSYMLGIAASWGFAYTLLMRSHVRVDALVRLLPSRVTGWIDLMALLGLGVVALILLVQAFHTLQASWSLNAHSMTPLQVPLWIPQALWVGGLGFFVVVIGVLAVKSLRMLASGDYAGAARLIGVQGVQAEADEILAETGILADRPRGQVEP